MSSRKLQAIVKTQYKFINNLLDRLEGKGEKVEIPNSAMVVDINGEFYHIGYVKKLLNDPYFKGLDLEQILELAKKSIRITTENRKLEDKLEKVEQKIINLKHDLCDNCGWKKTDGCNPSGQVCGDLLEIVGIIIE